VASGAIALIRARWDWAVVEGRIDKVARRHRITEAFAFDRNLVAAGLRFPGEEAR